MTFFDANPERDLLRETVRAWFRQNLPRSY